jgi:hypothetical protein
LNLLSGLGWFYLVKSLVPRFAKIRVHGFQYAALSALALLQLWSAVSYFPYYFTYQNPIMGVREFPLFPYGEGLELAGQYLAAQPNAKDATALVYYSRGCFSYFYSGTTIGFRPYYVDGLHARELLESVHSSDYIVVYYAVQGGIDKYGEFLDALSAVEPIHEIWLDGYKYVIIYQVDQIPEDVLQTFADLKPLPQ